MWHSLAKNDQSCRGLAAGVWIATGCAYLILLFFSLGILGPAPAFWLWSAAGLPLFLITSWWRRRVGNLPSARPAIATIVIWLCLAAAPFVVKTPTVEAPNVGQWLLIAALLIFPFTITWYVIGHIDSQSDGAA
jgi:hypothetical protein